MNLTNGSTTRGCGKRDQGGLYLCTGLSANGRPVEDFIADPAIPWEAGFFRAAQLIKRDDGIYDVAMCIGSEHYPFVPDFVEEGRVHGFSRKISASIDLSKITPYMSRFVFIHERGLSKTPYELRKLPSECRPGIERPNSGDSFKCSHPLDHNKTSSPCTFALWDLSTHVSEPKHLVHRKDPFIFTIQTPSVSYSVCSAIKPPHPEETSDGHFDSKLVQYEYAVFMRLPISHFEYVNKKGGMADDIAKKLKGNISHTAIVKE